MLLDKLTEKLLLIKWDIAGNLSGSLVRRKFFVPLKLALAARTNYGVPIQARTNTSPFL